MKLTFDVPEGLVERISEEIKMALEEYRKKQVWPQENDKYYYVRSCGEIDCTTFDNTSTFDKGCRNFNNCFKTEKEAKFKLEQLKVLHELEQLADDNQPWNTWELHYTIAYNHTINKFSIETWNAQHNSLFYFKSKESAQAAIDKIGEDRLKKYYFCIPEDE